LNGKEFEWDDDFPKNKLYQSAYFMKYGQEIYGYLIQFGIFSSEYVVYKVENGNRRVPICEIKTSRPSYMHTFAVTKNYVILVEIPFRLSMAFPNLFKPFIKSFRFHKDEKTRILCVHKTTGEVKEYFTKPFFFYHIANAYEKKNEIHLDLIGYDKPLISLKEKNVNNRLMRFKLKEDQTVDIDEYKQTSEYPVIHPDKYGDRYRYVYMIKSDQTKPYEQMGVGLYKFDLDTGCIKVFEKKGYIFGEPAFISRHPERSEGSLKVNKDPSPPVQDDTIKEDDGWLVGIMSDTVAKKSYLYLLDTKGMCLTYVQEMHHYVSAIGFHGRFFAACQTADKKAH